MAASEEEKFVAEFPGVRHKKQGGVLVLTSVRAAWSSGNVFQVNYPYNQIRAQRISAETSSKVQLQLILYTETQLNFHFTGERETALAQRNRCKELLQQILQQVQSDPHLQAKSSLLNSDPGLHHLYRELVIGGMISAEEFWANRLSQTGNASSSSQESGLPSAFLAELEAVSDGCNSMKLSVTTEVIQAIFRTYPSVRARHAELVPDQMQEEQFWVQFFQSQRFHRDMGSKSKNILSSCLAEELKSLKEQRQATKYILNTEEEPEEGYSVFSSALPPSSSSASSSSSSSISIPEGLVQRCNFHSSMVLQAISKDGVPQTDQLPDTSSGAQDLRLKLAPPTQTVAGVDPAGMRTISSELANWTPKQAVNHEAAYSATTHFLPGGSLMSGGGCGQAAIGQLSSEMRLQLFHHYSAVAELLRHYWACFPLLSPQLEEKAQRMVTCLQDYRDTKLRGLSESSLPESEVIGHLHSCIRTALERYQVWQNRSSRSKS